MRAGLKFASMAALAFAIQGNLAYAQDDDPERISESSQDDTFTQDTVVVTGSAIRGTPEDAALPVNVYSAQDLELQGSPTGLQFAKELTQSGPTVGEANYFGGGNLTGSPSFNLRGIGADKTLTLLNGRRMSENLSNIPSIALQRTEVLKDGAAVIYGADAVGGVVNFITKTGFEGFEARGNYKYVSDTDGEWDLGAIYGWEGDSASFLISAEWEHRSRLETEDRDWSYVPYTENPAPWSSLTNLGLYYPKSATGSFLSGAIADFNQSMCEAQDGVYTPNEAPGGQGCLYNYISYYNLVEDQDIYRIYSQLDTEINENMNFHVDFSYGQVKVPEQFASPSLPTTQGPATTTGATFQYRVPVTNPFVAEFANRSGWAANPYSAYTSFYDILLLRPFAHNGNPVGGRGEGFGNAASIDNQVWRVSASLDGTLGEAFGPAEDIGYNFGVTYNESISAYNETDILGFRLQEALNGFGGPACNAPDLDSSQLGTQNPAAAGVGDCMWYNPFSSAYASQPELGLANPNYVPGSENSDELVSWLFGDRFAETKVNSITLDAVFDGVLPVNLPGGQVGWAVGSQGRMIESRQFVPGEFYNGNTPCAWPVGQRPLPNGHPDFNGCTLNEPGPFGFFGTNPPDYYDQQSFSLFGETSLPITDDINVQAAVRREEFSGGLGATVYKLSGKWQVMDPLAFRASFGTNFQAPPITLQPGNISNVVRSYTVAGGAWLAGSSVTRTDITPEEAESWNIGAIWQSQGFSSDHDLTVILDYFDIHTMGEIGEIAPHNFIADAVFENVGGTFFADCSHPLIGRVDFNDNPVTNPGGGCTQGVTTALDLNRITTEIGNGSDQFTSGFDYQINYRFPIGEADATFGLTGTSLTELSTSARVLDGFEVTPEDDRLGNLNFSSVGFAAPKHRINAFFNYNRGDHNARLTARYVSGTTDERGSVDPIGLIPGSMTPVPEFTKGVEIDSTLTFDATYVYDLNENMRVTATMLNILDEDPPFVRAEFGYDPRMGIDALGRTIEVGLKLTY
ncbi:MAG: TonB-dependent receptor [Ponticaulis sp.]|nr:TonB-dependent receptor [Ponticaulis sp.]|tara:strand:- start:3883 stop:6957 length:3075 start_codon:yes stop_codon:yes gene_type:complete